MTNTISSLSMDKMVFEKILFVRERTKKSNTTFSFELEAMIGSTLSGDSHKVTLRLEGGKKDEYNIEIVLTGYFSFNSEENLSNDLKNEIISKNTVAILMPYLRSQVSLLTAQPEVDCVVLPPLNINNMIDDKQRQ